MYDVHTHTHTHTPPLRPRPHTHVHIVGLNLDDLDDALVSTYRVETRTRRNSMPSATLYTHPSTGFCPLYLSRSRARSLSVSLLSFSLSLVLSFSRALSLSTHLSTVLPYLCAFICTKDVCILRVSTRVCVLVYGFVCVYIYCVVYMFVMNAR